MLGASACSLCRTYCYRDRWLRFFPVVPTVSCTCGTLNCVFTSSVRGTCTCHGVHRVAPAVFVTSAPVVESTQTLHLRLPWSTSRQHNQCLTPRQHGYCLLCASACILCYLLRLQWVTSVLSLWSPPYTPSPVVEYIVTVPSLYVALVLCRGLHRPNTISVCYPALVVMYIATESSVNVSPSPIVEHIAPTQAMPYVEEFYESSHVRRRLLATRCGEQCSPVSLFVDTFHSCYKVSITKLTHRHLMCSPRTAGNAPHQGACADPEMENKNITARFRPWDRAVDLGTSEPSSLTVS